MTIDLPAMSLLHGACALVYVLLAVLILARKPRSSTGILLAGACVTTAVWAGSIAVRWQMPYTGLPPWLELARSAAWYCFILHLYRRSVAAQRQLVHAFSTMGLLAVLLVGGLLLANALSSPQLTSLWSVTTALRLGFPVASILLLENLYFNTPVDARWHINLLCVALGGIFLFDLLLYSDAILFRRISQPLMEGRAPVVALAAPLIALAAARNRRWRIDIHVSRNVVFHSATLVIAGLFLLALAVAGEVARRSGGNWGHVAETTMIFGGLMTVAVLLTSASVRSRLRVLLVDSFFSYRYDYRREWMRCIETLTAPDAHVGLHLRAIRAAAGVVDSPAGALFVRAPEEVSFQWAGSWNMPAITMPIPPGHPLLPVFRDGDWIAVFDQMAGSATWFPDLPRTWLAVPLNHFGTLIGFVVLAQSRAQFKLDREAFDLLRVVGREIASRVAEQRAAQVLSQTRQLREYSQRFAFVIHDIKNVSGQLSMLLSNAEVHADNPEFQRDMLATVRASVAKITRLLTRLQAEQQERSHALIAPGERLRDLVDVCRETHGATVVLDDDEGDLGVAMDPEAFDAVVTHLLNNAIEAAGPDSPVTVAVRHEGLSVMIEITDEGGGMPPEFVRDSLFQPFATTKGGGLGIGAYQARELLRHAGGDLLVRSQIDVGTTMTILLPALRAALTDATAV